MVAPAGVCRCAVPVHRAAVSTVVRICPEGKKQHVCASEGACGNSPCCGGSLGRTPPVLVQVSRHLWSVSELVDRNCASRLHDGTERFQRQAAANNQRNSEGVRHQNRLVPLCCLSEKMSQPQSGDAFAFAASVASGKWMPDVFTFFSAELREVKIGSATWPQAKHDGHGGVSLDNAAVMPPHPSQRKDKNTAAKTRSSSGRVDNKTSRQARAEHHGDVHMRAIY